MGITLTDLGLVCSLGNDVETVSRNASLGISPGAIKLSDEIVGKSISFFQTLDIKTNYMRCYDLLDCAVAQIQKGIQELKDRYRPDELGIVLGSSNTGIHEAQHDIINWMKNKKCPRNFSFEKIELGSAAMYLKKKVGFLGPAYVISTACSSSAKAFQSARNLIKSKICKAVIVGGVDSRCLFAHNGFFSLSALSENISNPFSVDRMGITLGEGAALFIMRENEKGIQLLGIGETTDAYDLTHPDPTGKGAYLAMKQALSEAHLEPVDINYINMHGTGTLANDEMEGRAIHKLFGTNPLCASTKPLTGHTLGAAGAIEMALSWLMLKNNFIIPHKYDGKWDDNIPKIQLATGKENIKINCILSNSFAFGGSNVSIILGGHHNGI